MTAANWEVGPILAGTNYSKGVPLNPIQEGRNWAIDFPVTGNVNYVTMSSGSLLGKTKISMKFRIEMEEGVKLHPTKYPGWPPYITFYFQREGDSWTAKDEDHRWWATFATVTMDRAGEYEMFAPFDGNWTAVMNSTATTKPSEFREARQKAEKVGFTFGGGDGYGHGVQADGKARIIVTDFRIE